MSGVPQAGRPPGRHAALILSKHFYQKKIKKIGNSKTKKNQGNILHFNQATVLLWCSHYDISDGPKPAQTRGEN